MGEDVKGFWHTLPGLITACAALVTAVAGVLGILVEADVLGGDREDRLSGAPPAAATSTDATSPAPPGSAPPGSAAPGSASSGGQATTSSTADADGSARVPWERATATLVRTDGTSASVKATSVGFACSTQTLTFQNGQRISLELVRSVRFTTVHPDDSSATGVVTLLDGRTLDDPVDTWNCPVEGTTELGPLSIPLDRFARVEFHR